jgi:hypothetical protein
LLADVLIIMPRIILSCFCDFGHQTLRDPSKREQYDMVTVLAAPPRNKWFGLFQAESGKSLHYVVILQLSLRGSRGAFGGSSQDTFSGSNNQKDDPFAEFYRQNAGPFSSKFYKIFSEVFLCLFRYTFPSDVI